MKPFTFMTVVLGLILGFMFAASRDRVVRIPLRPPGEPVRVQARYVPERPDFGDEDDREEAEGLPVPIVPGTRVSEAEIQPPRPVSPPSKAKHRSPRDRRSRENRPEPAPAQDRDPELPSTVRTISGQLSATLERARDDAQLQLQREVTRWLTPEVPTHWRSPASLVNSMVQKTSTRPIEKDYGTVYETSLDVDFSPSHRDQILAAYQREVVSHRLTILGGGLGFILACLASVAGYIRADEATKGYYTPWLRTVATAGVGAAGVLIYQLLA